MDNGWIKLHRKFLEWEWFDKSEMVHLYIFLLLDANHVDKNWRGVVVKRGQLVTSLANLKAKTNLSVRTIRTCLNRLKSTNEITVKTTNRYTVITICNYDDYQNTDTQTDKANDKPSDKQATNKRQSNDKQTTTNKNEKNNKNNKNNIGRVFSKSKIKEKTAKSNFKPPSLKEVATYCKERKNEVDPEAWVNFYTSNGWKVGKNPMKDWKASVRTWERNGINRNTNEQERATGDGTRGYGTVSRDTSKSGFSSTL